MNQPDQPCPPATPRLSRWLREPLLHFLLAGGALFAAYYALNRDSPPPDEPRRIVLSDSDLSQIAVAWRAQGRPQPGPAEMRALVEARIREELLYREALALGLDRDDTIVKRRLAQKMDFLAEDVSDLREPPPGELRAWFDAHAQRFARPPRVTFRHLYFSFDRRRDRTQADAADALTRLAGQTADAAAAVAADPFMFQDFYAERSPDQVAGVLGAQFARALFALAPGAWQGPIESGFGWHVVFIDAFAPAVVPQFEEIESDVRAEWTSAQRAAFRQAAYEAMKARYEIVLPRLDAAATPQALQPGGAARAGQTK